ncbi:hypothetical protein VitviT2T_029617 [Vitis vinifera]|uniref:Methionine gamma-lyase n=1 Tax=Vitis vinifera TaxID=29760 RepID=A0ABY9DXM5_VITVI|nr:hypothetical protein VitviT2T_029617 [Vitis vinifera]
METARAIKMIKMQNPNCLVMVDNCYGEFSENVEPPMVGADLIAGSLIKNHGGTIAPCGGYVAGKEKWVKAAAARLSAPGLGMDCGSTPGDIMQTFFQGLFLSHQMVGEAIKGGFLIAEVMASKGFKVQPPPRVPRHDTVQAVQLGTRECLLAFCEAVQRSSPVGSFTRPVVGSTPGYASEVILADRTFIDGSISELSCDGLLREPFAMFCQGGSHWTQWRLVLGEHVDAPFVVFSNLHKLINLTYTLGRIFIFCGFDFSETPNTLYSYNESRTTYSAGIQFLCDANHAFYSTTTLGTFFLLEEAQGAKSHINYHFHGSRICYCFLCWFVRFSGEQSIFYALGVDQRML